MGRRKVAFLNFESWEKHTLGNDLCESAGLFEPQFKREVSALQRALLAQFED
jgi:hypothetical protein